MTVISNVKPPPLAAPETDAAGRRGGERASAPAANPLAQEPAWGSVVDALKEKDETLATLLTGVANQPNAQTLLQVQLNLQQGNAQGSVASTLVRNEAKAQLEAISKMV